MTLKCSVLCSSSKPAEAHSGPQWRKSVKKLASNWTSNAPPPCTKKSRSSTKFCEGGRNSRGAFRISTPTNGDLGEHLWLVARWFYSNPREGEIFFREKDWPYRRILRACSRLLAPKTSPAETKPTPGPAQPPKGAP